MSWTENSLVRACGTGDERVRYADKIPREVEPDSVSQGTRWLTPGSRAIGLASLLSDLGYEVPSVMSPSCVTSTRGAPTSALGLIEV